MLSEGTQKGHEIDFTIIPILQMEKPGLREELTSPKPNSSEVAKSGLEPEVLLPKFTLLAITAPGLFWIYSHLYPCQVMAPTEAWQDLEVL